MCKTYKTAIVQILATSKYIYVYNKIVSAFSVDAILWTKNQSQIGNISLYLTHVLFEHS